MKRGDYTYIWQRPDWTDWRYDLPALTHELTQVSHGIGLLQGRLRDLGFELRDETSLRALSDDVIYTSEIEGEYLDSNAVRSSIARRLGVDIGALAPTDFRVEGVVELQLDATLCCEQALTAKRLMGWHAALFPTGYSGLTPVRVGQWRNDANGPMQVVSGPVHRPRVHFEAPPARRLAAEMKRFILWVNQDAEHPPLLKAGIAHLWFVTVHPFDDGNGRIGRAIGDLLLARADGMPRRFYSLSSQIQQARKAYYTQLESAQKGTMDITGWLQWFLQTVAAALAAAQNDLDTITFKSRFWLSHSGEAFNHRQLKLLNRLLDGFDSNLTSGRWARMAPCSPDTALRDIQDLVGRGILRKGEGGGRSTAYELVRDLTWATSG